MTALKGREPTVAIITSPEHFDVLIVGAGLSVIGAGFHLQRKCPTRSCAILEGRACLGGTSDLFRYSVSALRQRHGRLRPSQQKLYQVTVDALFHVFVRISESAI